MKTAFSQLQTTVILFAISFPCLLGAVDYYWVGGSGDWSDISHWATSSGGSVFHSQTPTANDNVFFDENSFSSTGQIISINGDIAFAKDLDFSNVTLSPTIRAGENTSLNIFGSIDMRADMVVDLLGSVILSSNELGNSVDFKGHTIGDDLLFDGSGSWTIQGNIFIGDELNILSGTITFQDAQVTCQYFKSVANSMRVINLGNSTFTISGLTEDFRSVLSPVNTYTVNLSTDNLEFTGGASTIKITNEYAKMLLNGHGRVELGNVDLTTDQGLFAIINYFNNTNFQISGTANLKHSSQILTTGTIDSLSLFPSHTYKFSPNEIGINYLNAIGNCSSPIIISTIESGNAASIIAGSPLVGEFLSLQDINIVEGSAIANNSVDLGNNDGWTVNAKISENYYWIGGTGSWSNGLHWSNSSGGTPINCVPSAVDNVIFDNNSFSASDQRVLVDVKSATCNDMTWENVLNGVSFVGPMSNSIFVYGSLRFDPNMTHEFLGDYHFVAHSKDHTIRSNGQQFNKDIIFNNPTGSWVLEDDLYVEDDILLMGGGLNTNSVAIDVHSFNGYFEFVRSLTLGSSVISMNRRDNDFFHWYLNADNLTFDSGTSHIIQNGYRSEFITWGNAEAKYFNLTFLTGGVQINSFGNVVPEYNRVTMNADAGIENNNKIDTLILKNGYAYLFGNESDNEIGIIITDDICDGLTYISAFEREIIIARIKLTQSTILNGVHLQGIHFVDSPEIMATQSFDGGSNQNVSFVEVASRNLFWVGGAGEWDDPSHWSETSGGAGGVCIPTIIDNVYFDDNSFINPRDAITNTNNNAAYCHDLNFLAQGITGYLGTQFINVSGDLNFESPWSIETTLNLVGGDGPQSVLSNGTSYSSFNLKGNDPVTLLDDLSVRFTIRLFENSTIIAEDKNIYCSQLFSTIFFQGLITIDAPETTFHIDGEFNPFSFPLFLKCNLTPESNVSSTTFRMTNPVSGAFLSSNGKYGNLIFEDNSESASLEVSFELIRFSKIQFGGNADIISDIALEVDSLLLSAGKSYVFQSNQDVIINQYLRARGNNCLPISWSSNISGSKVQLFLNDAANVDLDFIEMKDLSMNHLSLVDPGSHSTDIATSNSGWSFSSSANTDSEIGFFGEDIIVCNQPSIVLNPFSPDQYSSILWSTGSTAESIELTQDATIDALVVFTNNCAIRDTVQVKFEDDFTINLGQDTTICANEPLVLEIGKPNSITIWQDGSEGDEFEVVQPGIYSARSSLGICMAEDSIEVLVQSPSNLVLPPALETCEGEMLTVDANVSSMAEYMWSDGSTLSEIEVSRTGEYSVVVQEGFCELRDTFMATFHPLPTFAALPDQTICEGSATTISIMDEPDWTILWNNNATTNSISIADPGVYSVTVTDDNQCSSKDSMTLTTEPSPIFQLPSDTVICDGASITLGIDESYPSYTWSTGSSNPEIMVSTAGTYTLETTLGNCSHIDMVVVELQELPIVDLGDDLSFCEGDSVTYDVGLDQGTYLWSTGATSSIVTLRDAIELSVLVDVRGCQNTDEVSLTTRPTPVFELGEDIDLCSGDSVNLSIPTPSDWTVAWNDGSTSPELLVEETGTYTLRSEQDQCFYEDELVVTFHDYPEVDLGPDQVKCESTSVTLSVLQDDVDILWQDGSVAQEFNAVAEGLYEVEVTNVFGCTSSDDVMITDRTCSRFSLYLPNAFSPNGDGINDVYAIGISDNVSLSSYQLNIFDRWGNKVFQSQRIEDAWNGTFNGSRVALETYIAQIELTYTDDFETDVRRSFQESLTILK